MIPLNAVNVLVAVSLCLHLAFVTALDFKYHSNEDIEGLMRNWSRSFPNLTNMYSIGNSVRGAPLWVMEVSSHISRQSLLVPNVMFMANMHGNEAVGRELLLQLADHLLTQYGQNQTLTTFLDSSRLHLMPTMNPDGFASSRQEDCHGVSGRNNALGYDLNRNFPDSFHPQPDPEQKETQLVRQWLHSNTFVLSANLHGGALVANYPFDSLHSSSSEWTQVYSATPDDEIFQHLSLVYSRSHPTMHLGDNCQDSFKDGITNGASWYPLIGGLQDYVYTRASGYEILLEVSCCKFPPPDMLESLWLENKDALINLMMEVHRGVKGLIRSYQPLDSTDEFKAVPGAEVVVEGRESVPFRSNKQGEYFKLLLPGTYTLKISHPSYQMFRTKFQVPETGVTRLDITLRKQEFIESSPGYLSTEIFKRPASSQPYDPSQGLNVEDSSLRTMLSHRYPSLDLTSTPPSQGNSSHVLSHSMWALFISIMISVGCLNSHLLI